LYYNEDVSVEAIDGLQRLNNELLQLEAENNFEGEADQGQWSVAWMEWMKDEAEAMDNEDGAQYWTVRLGDAKERYEEISGYEWDGASHNFTDDSLVGKASEHVETTNNNLNDAIAYRNILRDGFDLDDDIVTLPEAQAYLDAVQEELGKDLKKAKEYINWRTNTINKGIDNLRRFASARDDILDLTDDIASDSAKNSKIQNKALSGSKRSP